MKDYWKVPLAAVAIATLGACSADGGFPGGSRGGSGDVDCTATPDDPACTDGFPDISDWNPTRLGAANGTVEFGNSCQLAALLDPLVTCTFDPIVDSYDGDTATQTPLDVSGGGGSDFFGAIATITYETGPVPAGGNNVAAVLVSAPAGNVDGLDVTISTQFEGVDTDEPAIASTSNALNTGSGIDGLVGFKNTVTYDTIIVTISAPIAEALPELNVVDVVTAATAPPAQ